MTTTEELVAEAIENLVTTLVRQPRLPGDEDTGDLTTFQAIALATLVDDGALRLGALATRLGTTDATASRNVDVLERLGLVARVPDDADGRGIVVAPTVLGTQTRDRPPRPAETARQTARRAPRAG